MKMMRIPGAIARPIIQDYLDNFPTYDVGRTSNENRLPAYSALRIIAAEAEMKPDSLWRFMIGRSSSLDFYTFDRILCAMDSTSLWYEWPLLVFYLAADLTVPPSNVKICARLECPKEILMDGSYQNRGRKFCSATCRDADWKHRSGYYTNRAIECRNGHPRTPENTRIYSRGKMCLECNRINARERRAERRLAVSA
jgi:hypothetical protein